MQPIEHEAANGGKEGSASIRGSMHNTILPAEQLYSRGIAARVIYLRSWAVWRGHFALYVSALIGGRKCQPVSQPISPLVDSCPYP